MSKTTIRANEIRWCPESLARSYQMQNEPVYAIEDRVYTTDEVKEFPRSIRADFVAVWGENRCQLGWRFTGERLGQYCPTFVAANGYPEFLEPEETRCAWCTYNNSYGPYGCPQRFTRNH